MRSVKPELKVIQESPEYLGFFLPTSELLTRDIITGLKKTQEEYPKKLITLLVALLSPIGLVRALVQQNDWGKIKTMLDPLYSDRKTSSLGYFEVENRKIQLDKSENGVLYLTITDKKTGKSVKKQFENKKYFVRYLALTVPEDKLQKEEYVFRPDKETEERLTRALKITTHSIFNYAKSITEGRSDPQEVEERITRELDYIEELMSDIETYEKRLSETSSNNRESGVSDNNRGKNSWEGEFKNSSSIKNFDKNELLYRDILLKEDNDLNFEASAFVFSYNEDTDSFLVGENAADSSPVLIKADDFFNMIDPSFHLK